MSQEDIYINGELLRLRREARGWVLNDMATRACMSVKQIRQLEDGGMSSFYSLAVKVTAAKKVGALLGLSPEEVFAQVVEPTPELGAVDSETAETVEGEVTTEVAAVTEPLHDVAPVLPVEVDHPSKPVIAAEPVADEVKPKTSLWVIGGLFAAALAVAAYLQPQEEPAAEPAPPLQVIPSEDPASAASASEGSASGAVEVASVATIVAKPASSPVAIASSTVAVASSVRPAASAASSPAPAASKAP
jgi:transcriptional regulator with XRE-family HTH domain